MKHASCQYLRSQKYHNDNNDLDAQAAAWTNWSVNVTPDLGQRSPSRSSQAQMSLSSPGPRVSAPSFLASNVMLQPGVHLRRHDNDESCGVSPSGKVPSIVGSELNSSSTSCQQVSWPLTSPCDRSPSFLFSRYYSYVEWFVSTGPSAGLIVCSSAQNLQF